MTVKAIEQQLKDNIELIELGEEEGDAGDRQGSRDTPRLCAPRFRRKQVEAHALGRGRRQRYLSRSAFRRRRHGKPGLGQHASAHVYPLGRAPGYKVEVLEVHDGEEAGIKSATVLIKGHNAYGWLKTESGVHRLVRISPYDSNARRHTSFSSASWVYPVIDDSIQIEINESDAASTPTARRAPAASTSTRPTRPCASRTSRPASSSPARQERSQHKNRAKAWEMLRSRLYEDELKKREAPPMRPRRPSPISAGATRSGPTSCSPTSSSRICAPASKAPAPRTCSTASSTSSWRLPCRSASRAAQARKSPISTKWTRRLSRSRRTQVGST
jgi:peptide chain release factor 2